MKLFFRGCYWLLVLALLLPALLLTYTRLAEPESGEFIRLVAFTPLGLPLYGASALLLLLRMLIRRGPIAGLLLLGSVAGLALHGWWLAPQFIGANPPPVESAQPVTVMTVNMEFGRADAPTILAEVSARQVDILVVEEITPLALERLGGSGLTELLPFSAGEPGTGAEGTMIFTRDHPTEVRRIPTGMGSWELRVSGLLVQGVHPAPPTYPHNWLDDHRVIFEFASTSAPDLIVGDFNATPDHRPMRDLADLGYASVAELADQGWQPTWPANGRFRVAGFGVPTLVQIDQVLVGSRLAGLSTESVLIPGTDHRALVAQVAVK